MYLQMGPALVGAVVQSTAQITILDTIFDKREVVLSFDMYIRGVVGIA